MVDEQGFFVDLTRGQALELRGYGEVILLHGEVPEETPELVTQWLEQHGVTDGQRLLFLSTVLPGKLFYSLLRHQELYG